MTMSTVTRVDSHLANNQDWATAPDMDCSPVIKKAIYGRFSRNEFLRFSLFGVIFSAAFLCFYCL